MSLHSKILNSIKSVITELENNNDIVIDELEINPPSSSAELDAEEKLPEIIREFYKEANGLVLSWHAKEDPLVKGGVVIPLLENIHNTRWASFGILDYTEDVHAVFHKKAGEDSRVLAESLAGDEDIEFQEIAGGIVSIESYFEAFRKTRGFRFWQENFDPNVDYSIESIIENRGYLWGDSYAADVPEIHSAHVPN